MKKKLLMIAHLTVRIQVNPSSKSRVCSRPLQNKFICIKLATFDTHFVHKILRKRFEDEGQSRDDICILFISLKINVYCLCKVFVKRFLR